MLIEGVEILLVEDSPDDAALTLRALKKCSLANKVHAVQDGAEALAWLRGNHRPKVVLLDLKLPKVSGLEVLAEVRADEALADIPIVILTSSREEPDVARAYALGVNSYIVKPVDLDQFMSAVSQAGLYWLVINEAPCR
ncbi:MAG: response regulator [Vicinamibacterales bacterium]